VKPRSLLESLSSSDFEPAILPPPILESRQSDMKEDNEVFVFCRRRFWNQGKAFGSQVVRINAFWRRRFWNQSKAFD